MTAFTYTNPTVGGSEDTWGTILNDNWTALGTFLGALDSAELAVLDGITATTAELNLLDGVTATTAELNIMAGATLSTAELNLMDGCTSTTVELNYTTGVTSAIQTQLDAKAALASPALTGTPTAPTASSGTNTTQVATTAFVEAATTELSIRKSLAAASVGEVGTYAIAGKYASSTHSFTRGSTYTGSTLKYGGAATTGNTTNDGANQSGYPQTGSITLSGTWRAMGEAYRGSEGTIVTLFLRVS